SYQYDFGDNTSASTTSPSVRHTYSAPGVYTVTVVTLGTYGTKAYFLSADTTDSNCSLRMFAGAAAMPFLIAALAFGFTGAVLVIFKRSRRVGYVLLVIAVALGIAFVALAFYVNWQVAVPW